MVHRYDKRLTLWSKKVDDIDEAKRLSLRGVRRSYLEIKVFLYQESGMRFAMQYVKRKSRERKEKRP
jgi:hypothetical protein